MVSKTLNFNFPNWISLLLISSSYPIVLTRLGGPIPDPILLEKFLEYSQESNPGPLGVAVRRVNHDTKELVILDTIERENVGYRYLLV